MRREICTVTLDADVSADDQPLVTINLLTRGLSCMGTIPAEDAPKLAADLVATAFEARAAAIQLAQARAAATVRPEANDA